MSCALLVYPGEFTAVFEEGAGDSGQVPTGFGGVFGAVNSVMAAKCAE